MVLAVVYLVVGITFATLAGSSASHEMRVMWRLAAYAVSALVFAAHIGSEHFRLRHTPRRTALHTSVAVALGAFALAVAANIHSLGVVSSDHRLLAFALLAWPLLCGLPAFVVAFAVAAALRLRSGSQV